MQAEARIMHVITDFSRPEGAQSMLARILRLSHDHEVTVASIIGVSEANKALAGNAGVSYRALGMGSPFGLPSALSKLVSIIRDEQPTVILSWMYHAMAMGAVAGRLTKTPCYWSVRQALDDTGSFGLSTKLALAACRTMSHWPEGIMYNSSKAHAQHENYGYSNPNSLVIPNGFDIPCAPPVRQTGRVRVFGIAGRLHPQKDHATFFAAAAQASRQYPDLRFRVAGKGLTYDAREVQNMLEAAGALAENFEFLGELSDMPSFYKSIDALVLTSRTEGFPNVVAEAMSYGKPVITTDVGDAADIVAETGIVCPVQDPGALASAMVSFAEMPSETFERHCLMAKKRIEDNYSLARIYSAYNRFLKV